MTDLNLTDLNWLALGWSVVWTVLAAALVAQLVLRSIPESDAVFIAVDIAALVFVSIRLRKSVPMIISSSDAPDRTT